MAENKLLKAWHASPYDFEQFGPMRQVSGRGQGAAVYGRGAAYVAESPKVSGPGSSTYMSEFSNHPAVKSSSETLGGIPIDGINLHGRRDQAPFSELSPAALEIINGAIEGHLLHGGSGAKHLKQQVEWDTDDLISNPEDYARSWEDPKALVAAAKEARAFVKKHHAKQKKTGGPFSYEVEVHLQPETMLDWDAELRHHHPEALAKIKTLIPSEDDGPDGSLENSGSAVYEMLKQLHGSDFDASEALFNAGIHGIRYKDAGSRNLSRQPHVWLDGEKLDASRAGDLDQEHAENGGPVDSSMYHGLASLKNLPLIQAPIDNRPATHEEMIAEVERHLAEVMYPSDEELRQDPYYAKMNFRDGNTKSKGTETFERALEWLKDPSNHGRIEVRPERPTYNYVIFHPDFVRAVAQYNIKGEKVKDLGPGVHLKATDKDPFDGE